MPAPDYDLDALRAAANEACVAAIGKCAEIKGAVNWGDLGCHEASRYETDRGETGYFVTISEASYNASDLMFFISRELKNSGFANIEVRLEW